MTPVAIPVAVTAASWDAALEETLSCAAERAFADGTRAAALSAGTPAHVHSVHRRVINVLIDDVLVALASLDIDDAPATVRVPVEDWRRLGVKQDSPVDVSADRIVLAADGHDVVVSLAGARAWTAPASDLERLGVDELTAALGVLEGFRASEPVTPFGHAAQELLVPRTAQLRRELLHGDERAVHAAANSLIGLGEGLTPSGDDILTGLVFLAAQPGALLSRRLPSLAAAIRDGRTSTGLLSHVTLSHAAEGRARQSLHELAGSLVSGDLDRMRSVASAILEIGHTSGADILTGIRLALDVERSLRASRSAATTPPTESRIPLD